MRSPLVVRARALYGAHPLQLVLILFGFAVVAYALSLLGFTALWNPDTWWQSIAVWFVGAALAHDLLLFPVYAFADRILVIATGRRRSARSSRSGPSLVNFVRVPLLAAGLITLLFFPGIIEQGAGAYNRATGQTQQPFLHRWVILCALILLSGLIAYLFARAAWKSRPPTSPDQPVSSTNRAHPITAASSRPAALSTAHTLVVFLLVLLAACRRRR